MAYFIPKANNPTEPDFTGGAVNNYNPDSGHTLEATLEEFTLWYEQEKLQEVSGPDWLQLIQDVNLGPILMPWMLQNANPSLFAYLLAVINNIHRQPWMLYAALDMIFNADVDLAILAELVDVLDRNNFDSNQLSFLKVAT